MRIKDVQLIVFDLDDTLTESKQPLSFEMGQVLKRLLDEKYVAVMSGARLEQFIEQLISRLPEDTHLTHLILLPTSGAEYVAYKDGEWTSEYSHTFTREEKQKIVSAFVETLQETGVQGGVKEVYGEQIEDRGAQITFSALGQEAPLQEKRTWDPRQEKRKKMVSVLASKLPGMSIRIGGTTSIDVTQEGVDKAYGIEELSRRTGVPVEDMLYIGDALYEGGNDAPVLRTKIATKQVSGPEEVRTLFS